MIINVIGRPPRRRLFLIQIVSNFFWHVPASSSLLWLVPRRSIFYKQRRHRMFWLANLLDFITRDRKHHYKVGQLKVGKALQIGTGITKRDNFHVKWDNNYEVMQYRRQMIETEESNIFWQLAPLFTQRFTPSNSWEVEVLL